MSANLFEEFDSVSSKQWKQKIQVDLKGADYNETLILKTPEGIDVKPFYHQDDQHPEYTQKTGATGWNICQRITVNDEITSNQRAKEALAKGATSLWFVIENLDISFSKLFNEIDVANTVIHISTLTYDNDFFVRGKDFANGKSTSFYLHADLIATFARSGNWSDSQQTDLQSWKNLVDKTASTSVSVDMTLYQNAGSNIVQQLAYGMAHANEYLNLLETDTASGVEMCFNVAVGSNYFFEIAKLRALRLLYSTMASAYENSNDCRILAIPTKRNKTLYDYNTNMLRATTECMSAVLGGVDDICNLPYDAIYHKENEFGDRISRNQLLILKSESYFDKVNNPADGAYYIEELTQQLAEKALDLFKDIEANGGLIKQLVDGTIQRKIKESANKEQSAFDEGKEVLIGTNKYPNDQDRMKHDLELDPFVAKNPRKTSIVPIIERRLAEKIEKERLATEA